MAKLKDLQQIVETQRAERARDEERVKAYQDRVKEINSAADHAMHMFYCETCEADHETVGHKIVQRMESWPIAWYIGYCPKTSARMVRRITDKIGDPFYWQSVTLRDQQKYYAEAFLTPDDPQFRKVYPVQWERIQQERRERENLTHEA
jgi:hypothetical protein